MWQKMLNHSIANFFFMAVPAFSVNALVQHLFGSIDYQLAGTTAVVLGAFWAVFMRSEKMKIENEKRHS